MKTLKSLSAKTLATIEFPPPDWLVQGLWTHGEKIIVAGETATFKSWIITDLLLHLCAGIEWLGFKIPVKRKGLYVDEEMSLKLMTRRLRRLAMGAGIDLTTLEMEFMNQQGVKMSSMGSQLLIKTFESFNPDVIVFDTLLQVFEGDVNDNSMAATFWSRIKPMIDQGNRTVIVTHHMTKPGDPSLPQRAGKHRTLGAGYIVGGADAQISLMRKDSSPVALIEPGKTREGMEPPPFQVMVKDVGPCEKCFDGVHVCPARLIRVVKGETAKIAKLTNPFDQPLKTPYDSNI